MLYMFVGANLFALERRHFIWNAFPKATEVAPTDFGCGKNRFEGYRTTVSLVSFQPGHGVDLNKLFAQTGKEPWCFAASGNFFGIGIQIGQQSCRLGRGHGGTVHKTYPVAR